MDLEDYEARMSELWTNVKACGGKGAVFMPGEQSYLTKLASVENVDLQKSKSMRLMNLLMSLVPIQDYRIPAFNT